MQTMWRCGHLRGRPCGHAVPQYVHARLPEVPSVLGDNHRFEPDSVFGRFRGPEMHFFGGAKSGATAHGAPMELLQFVRRSTTQARPEISENLSLTYGAEAT